MQEQQAKRLQTINSEVVEYADGYGEKENVIADYNNTEYSTTSTNMLVINNVLTLTRVIASSVYRVEFSCETKCCDIVQWFEINDKTFMQCSKRTSVELQSGN